MKKILKNLLIILVICSGSINCTKDKDKYSGPPGPEGEQGPPGTEIGSRGPQGDKGDPGDMPDIIYSDWKSIILSDNNASYSGELYRFNLSAPELTQDILDQTDFSLYFKTNKSPKVYKAFYDDKDDAQLSFMLSIAGSSGGHINIYTNMFDKWDIDTLFLRYIIIPGGAPLNNARYSTVPDLRDYEAVCRYFGINE